MKKVQRNYKVGGTMIHRRPLDKPFELYLLGVCTLFGWQVILGGPQPSAIQSALDPTIVIIWAYMLAAGGMCALLGIFWRGRISTSYGIEQCGLLLIGGACLIYAIGVAFWIGFGGGFAISETVAFSAACFTRTFVIQRFIQEIVKENKTERQ